MTVHSAGKGSLDYDRIQKRRENRMRSGAELSAQRAAQSQAGMVAPPAPAYNYNYPDSPNYQPSLVNWTHGSQPYQGRTNYQPANPAPAPDYARRRRTKTLASLRAMIA